MSGFNISETVKKGWHPKGKDGKSNESWRGDFKGIDQISGWMGKPKTQVDSDATEHVARPLSSLKDPKSFAPPPKKRSLSGLSSPTIPTTSTGSKSVLSTTDERQTAEILQESKAPSEPFRKDTTGLSTSHLPPPPSRRDGADGRAPTPKAKPSLPPRVPPRQNASPNHHTHPSPAAYREITPEPLAHRGILNQDSISNLSAAGVSVPGFDIKPSASKSNLKKPPPIPSRKSISTPTIQSHAHDPQLTELQSRFSQIGTSSPKDEQTSQGTTWTEKQSALKTASSLRNGPSKVSLADARNAASTFNNFRERHGSQFASGLRSANALNSTYGVTDKIGSYNSPGKEVALENDQSPISMRDNTISPPAKKPPPLPKKKPGLGAIAHNFGEPPPIPLASKPESLIVPRAAQNIEDFDLDLKSQWFANQHITFPPPSIQRIPGDRGYRYSSGWSSNGVRKTCTFVGLVTYKTLAYTKIHISWDASNPGLTAKAEQKHFPPPIPLSKSELDHYRQQYSEHVARWCEQKIGTQVGNGECWTLANDALNAIASDCSARGQEPCMTSQSYVHGGLIYEKIGLGRPEPSDGVLAAGVARGDILQFWNARLEARDGRSWKSAGAPDHTAVITQVEGSGVLRIVEQNIGGVKIVKEGNYDVDELVKGEVRIFRPVGVNWVGPLEPTWP